MRLLFFLCIIKVLYIQMCMCVFAAFSLMDFQIDYIWSEALMKLKIFHQDSRLKYTIIYTTSSYINIFTFFVFKIIGYKSQTNFMLCKLEYDLKFWTISSKVKSRGLFGFMVYEVHLLYSDQVCQHWGCEFELHL